MQLISDWRRVVARSLSFWMGIAGLVVLGAPELRYAWAGVDSDPVFVWYLGFFLILAGLAGRLVQQDLACWQEWLRLAAVAGVVLLVAFLLASSGGAMSSKKIIDQKHGNAVSSTVLSEQQTLAVAVPFIAEQEGKRNRAYQDIVGVWTICYGHTHGVQKGMVLSDAECLDLLHDEVSEYREGLHWSFTEETKVNRLTAERDTAYTSLAFNCGIEAISKSTATRRLNAGDVAGGCEALTWWNKAGGRVIRGLVNRRKREHGLCVAGL